MMAKYTVEITETGKIETLGFMGKKFVNTWVPTGAGSKTLEKCFKSQIEEAFPDINEDDLELVGDISCSDLDEIEDIIWELSEYERCE